MNRDQRAPISLEVNVYISDLEIQELRSRLVKEANGATEAQARPFNLNSFVVDRSPDLKRKEYRLSVPDSVCWTDPVKDAVARALRFWGFRPAK